MTSTLRGAPAVAGRRRSRDGDLPLDVAAAAFRMGVDADKAARAALDDLLWHVGRFSDSLRKVEPIPYSQRRDLSTSRACWIANL